MSFKILAFHSNSYINFPITDKYTVISESQILFWNKSIMNFWHSVCLLLIYIWRQKMFWENPLYWFCPQFSSDICSGPIFYFKVIWYYYFILFFKDDLCCFLATYPHLGSKNVLYCKKLEYLGKNQDWKTHALFLLSVRDSLWKHIVAVFTCMPAQDIHRGSWIQ